MPILTAHAAASPSAHGDDRVAIVEYDGATIIVVADGVGGMSGGALAAEMLIEIVREAVVAPAFAPLRPESWVDVLEQADLALDHHPLAGETTAVVVAVSENHLVGASVGDSGAWVVQPDGVDDLTSGQHKKPRLGSGRARPISFTRPRLDGTLLVATDGLFNYASRDRIASVVRQMDINQAVRDMVQLVRLPAGGLQDDVGVAAAWLMSNS